MERRAAGPLDAMIGPQRLVAVMEPLLRERLGGVGRGERGVAGRMPVLGHDDMGETADERVHGGNDRIALVDRQRPAGHEIGLQVDRQQDVVVVNRDRRRHESGLL